MTNPAKIPEPTQTVKFLGITWAEATPDIPQATKNKQVSYLPLALSKEHSIFRVWIWRMHMPHLGVLLTPIVKLPERKQYLKWSRNNSQKQWLNQNWAVMIHTPIRFWKYLRLVCNTDWSLWQQSMNTAQW